VQEFPISVVNTVASVEFNEHDLDRRSYLMVAGGVRYLALPGTQRPSPNRRHPFDPGCPRRRLLNPDSGVGVKNGNQPIRKKKLVGTFGRPLGGDQRCPRFCKRF